MNTYEEQKAIIAKFNVIDDVFFQKMVEDIGVAEEIIRIILQKPKLNVIKCETQRFLRNIGAHSVVLDLVCEDEDNSIIHVEVQKKDDDDHQKRVRFNVSNIDTIFTEKGIEYDKIPDVYAIFISKFDVFKGNKTIYHINRVIEETGAIVENGIHEIYVNATVDDKSDISELMQYFKNSVGEHENFKKLCNRVKYFKESQEGVSNMCQVMEDYAKKVSDEKLREKDIQTATNLLKNGVSVSLIANSIPTLAYEDIVELSRKIENNDI
jgi:predicted transposase/invertase (TIGR01784 family)